MSFSWISHNAKKSTLHPLAMGRKALSLTKSSPQSSGGHCVHMGEAQSSRHVGLGCFVLVLAKETLVCCQKSEKRTGD